MWIWKKLKCVRLMLKKAARAFNYGSFYSTIYDGAEGVYGR